MHISFTTRILSKIAMLNDITWVFPVPIFTQIGEDYRRYRYKLICFLKPSKTVTKSIFAKPTLTGQFFKVTRELNFMKILQTL